jgi:hypothetical protein
VPHPAHGNRCCSAPQRQDPEGLASTGIPVEGCLKVQAMFHDMELEVWVPEELLRWPEPGYWDRGYDPR